MARIHSNYVRAVKKSDGMVALVTECGHVTFRWDLFGFDLIESGFEVKAVGADWRFYERVVGNAKQTPTIGAADQGIGAV